MMTVKWLHERFIYVHMSVVLFILLSISNCKSKLKGFLFFFSSLHRVLKFMEYKSIFTAQCIVGSDISSFTLSPSGPQQWKTSGN